MEILIPDTTTSAGAALARDLEAEGHSVHCCRVPGQWEDGPCAAHGRVGCPLDVHPVDVAVGVGPPEATDHLTDGNLCAVRRRIPLVLVDRPHDRLERWAAAVVSASRAAQAVREVHDGLLATHTAEAAGTVNAQLRRLGLDEDAIDVSVWRQEGGLEVELSVRRPIADDSLEKLAVHVAQRLRLLDPWARTLDVSLSSPEEGRPTR